MCERRRVDLMLTGKIAAIHRRSRDTYGSPPSHASPGSSDACGEISAGPACGSPRLVLQECSCPSVLYADTYTYAAYVTNPCSASGRQKKMPRPDAYAQIARNSSSELSP